jgi:hypothetical protein
MKSSTEDIPLPATYALIFFNLKEITTRIPLYDLQENRGSSDGKD